LGGLDESQGSGRVEDADESIGTDRDVDGGLESLSARAADGSNEASGGGEDSDRVALRVTDKDVPNTVHGDALWAVQVQAAGVGQGQLEKKKYVPELCSLIPGLQVFIY
jgi:hypothetical protein